jgi:tetratricopeptide (TPR) repeat protein
MRKPKRSDPIPLRAAQPFELLFGAGRPSPRSGRMRNIVALLANLQDPERLVGHPYARIALERLAFGSNEVIDTTAAVRALCIAARAALTNMRDNEKTYRLYSVISRCDVQGCPHKVVARELGLSRRQFYRDLYRARLFVEKAIFARWERSLDRDKSSAVATLAERLSPRVEAASRRYVMLTDRYRLELAFIQSLEQVGEFEAASNRLRALANDIVNPARRSLVLGALSGAFLELGRVDAAREHCDRAMRDAEASGDSLVIGEAETAAARIALAFGDMVDSEAKVRRSISRLRALPDAGERTLRVSALARALLVRSDAEVLLGRFISAQDCALEAENELQTSEHSDRALYVEAQIAVAATTGFISTDPTVAESEMCACYDAAIDAGLIVKAVEAGIILSTIYRYQGKFDRATQLLRSMLPIAHRVSRGRIRLSFFISLGNALAASGKAQEALDALNVASRWLVSDHKIERACLSLAMARAYLGVGRVVDAIHEAEQAEERMERLGLIGFLGASLHVQANGLTALGRRSEALVLSRRSVEALSASGHPEALRAAKATLARLRVGSASA